MKNLTINQLTELIMAQAKDKGFGTTLEEISVAEKIALIHSEVSEAFEAYRHKNINDKDGFAEELGDVVQRVLHLAGIFGIDIEKEILNKVKFNKDREWKWGEMNEKNTK